VDSTPGLLYLRRLPRSLPFVNWVKRIGIMVLFGAFGGSVIASLVVPGYLSWDNTPGSGQALCNCATVAKETAIRLIHGQLIGAAIGATVFLALGIAWRVTSGKKPPAVPPAATPTAPAGSFSAPPKA
jgi:hypothetical protein